MVSKRFRVQCVGRVLLLSVTLLLCAVLLVYTTWYATILLVGGLVVFQVYALVQYVERTNRDLTRFLQAIQYSDFSQTFTGRGLGSSFGELHAAFTAVADEFRRVRAEKEEQYRYLQTVVQHIGIGVMAFQPDGNVELMNPAARRLLLSVGPMPPGPLRNIHAFASHNPLLIETLLQLKSGDKTVVKVGDHHDLVELTLHATAFKLRDRQVTLVSIQNIRSELEDKEMEAWQNLIRVLTHEIMNSVTPIASLASTVNDLFPLSEGAEAQADTMQDIRSALQTIHTRSQGLLHFIEAYRNLTRIPKPGFRIVRVTELFARVERLMHAQMADNRIDFRVAVEPDSLEVTADPELVEQVLINLLLNAVQALQGQSDARIELTARMDDRGRIIIQVTDNGPGILEEVLEKIFIPFFTTKQDGSGIGLSLSRQIMRLHQGTISVHSIPNVETVLTLRF